MVRTCDEDKEEDLDKDEDEVMVAEAEELVDLIDEDKLEDVWLCDEDTEDEVVWLL